MRTEERVGDEHDARLEPFLFRERLLHLEVLQVVQRDRPRPCHTTVDEEERVSRKNEYVSRKEVCVSRKDEYVS